MPKRRSHIQACANDDGCRFRSKVSAPGISAVGQYLPFTERDQSTTFHAIVRGRREAMVTGNQDIPFAAPERRQVLDAITKELNSAGAPRSIKELAPPLKRLLIGTRWSIPTIGAGARLFRVRRTRHPPSEIAEIGAPPKGKAGIGRVNNAGDSVLYLSDTPDTAINELRLGAGCYCLSEWRVTEPRVGLANGGITEEDLLAVFGSENQPVTDVGGQIDGEMRDLFRSIFKLVPDHDPALYRWSISAAMAAGFAHACERTGRSEQNGATVFEGLYPFAGIAYTSVRSDKRRVNFAFNDLGQTYVTLKNIQWIDRRADGSIAGLDFATSWNPNGRISWLGRPAIFSIPQGGTARLTKLSEAVWTYESLDGHLPDFA